MLGRVNGARQQAPSIWSWVRTSARKFISHGRTSSCRQPATRTIQGRGDVCSCKGWARRPSQPIGLLKPTAVDSDPSESGVPSETTNRCMSSDMSGPLSDKSDGTTANAQVANACLPVGERPNKTHIFISGFGDARSFLAWLQASYSAGLTAQIKSEK